MIIIIDNRSFFIRIFETKLIRQNIPYRFYYHNEQIDLSQKDKIKGIILSGGAGNPYDPLNLSADYVAMMNFDVPIIGLCLGHEIIGVAYGGTIATLKEYQNKMDDVIIDLPDPIFEGIDVNPVKLRQQHQFEMATCPDSFDILAHSDVCHIEVMKHKTKPIYGFQSHPEVSGRYGNYIMNNFIKMCNL